MGVTTSDEPRDSSGSGTSRLVFAVLAGNVFAAVCVAAFRPFPGQNGFLQNGGHLNMVLTSGTMTLVACGLLFLVSAVRRRQRAWWTLLTIVDVVQILRLAPALAAISMWSQEEALTGMLWGFAMVPSFGLLAAVGVIVTLREMRRAKRRRLQAARA
jgi:hypothetical protein